MDLFFSQDFHFFGSPLKKWKVEVKSKVLLQKAGFWARAAFCPAYLGSATAWMERQSPAIAVCSLRCAESGRHFFVVPGEAGIESLPKSGNCEKVEAEKSGKSGRTTKRGRWTRRDTPCYTAHAPVIVFYADTPRVAPTSVFYAPGA